MKQKIVLLIASQEIFFEETIKILDQFEVPWNYTSPQNTSFKNSSSLGCAITAPTTRAESFLKRHELLYYPIIVVPETSPQANKNLAQLQKASNFLKDFSPSLVALGKAGQINAALLAVSILSLYDHLLLKKWMKYRAEQTQSVLETSFLYNPIR